MLRNSLDPSGKLYEIQIRKHLASKDKYDGVYIWDTKIISDGGVPYKHLKKSGLCGDWNKERIQRKTGMPPDIGCDILAHYRKDDDDYYDVVQCKNYSSNNSVRLKDLSGFCGLFAHELFNKQNVDGKVYYTSKLSTHLNDRKELNPRIKYIRKAFNQTVTNDGKNNWDKDYCSSKLKPRDYQKEAYNKLKGKDRAILQLPCGMGKTLISIMLAKDYNHVIVFGHFRSLVSKTFNDLEVN